MIYASPNGLRDSEAASKTVFLDISHTVVAGGEKKKLPIDSHCGGSGLNISASCSEPS